MNRIRIKICGLTTVAGIRAAIEAGADAIGIVLSPSTRQVSVTDADALLREVPPMVSAVIVTRQPPTDLKQEILQILSPQWWQSDYRDFDNQTLPAGTQALPVYREGDVLSPASHAFVYEGAQSGQGQTVNWETAARFARRGRMILAGGLNPANVGEAIRTVKPYAVDVSSGVESSAGVKDPKLIKEFVAAVRLAEQYK